MPAALAALGGPVAAAHRELLSTAAYVGTSLTLQGGRNFTYCSASPENNLVCAYGDPANLPRVGVLPAPTPPSRSTGESNLSAAAEAYVRLTLNGMYCADTPRAIVCNSSSYGIGPEYIFRLYDLGRNKIVLRGGRSKKFCSDADHGVVCDSVVIAKWEYFVIQEIGMINDMSSMVV